MVVAVVLQLVGNLGGIAIGFVTAGSVSPALVVLTVVGVSVVSGLAVALLPRGQGGEQAPSRPPATPSAPPGHPGRPPYPAPVSRPARTVSVTAVLLVILLLCGGVGAAGTYGVQWAVGEVRERVDPGSEPGEQRGRTLQAAAQHSDWATTVGADAQVTGVIVFTGTPPATATTASPTFANIFVLGGGSITVRRIDLKASVTDR